MAERVVVWTDTARIQRRAIFKYWTRRNKSISYAEKLLGLITRHIESILQNPELFKESTFENHRESAMGHFSIFYKVEDTRLIITAFWDNRQDPKKLLELLK